MAATVLFPPAQCHRAATATTSGRGGCATSHCCALLLPRHRRRGPVRAAVPPDQSSLPQAPAPAAASYGRSAADVKAALYAALDGANRGIFGMTSAKRSEIHGLVELLESTNPTPEPTAELQAKVDGCWKLIYSTISILGKTRTKLGLRDFISLGDFLQIIDVKEEKAVNVIEFSARALKIFSGKLTIEASYTVTSQTRVDIKLQSSTITPEQEGQGAPTAAYIENKNQLMNIFQKNYDMLLDIFNPEGWLEITYVDESLRIGRDDKENIFVLERADPSEV